jgi:hypothetical protein
MATFLAALEPTACCIVRQFAWPAVFCFVLMVVLLYKEERYGLDRCSMIAV